MATFTDIYKNELKSKGVLSSLGSAVVGRAKERMDPRNFLFGGKGIVAATGQKIFGKGYSAIPKNVKEESENLKKASNDSIVEQLANQNMRLAIVGKNTMPLRAMSRDINVMRQNMVKLVKLNSNGGVKAATKADMFFRKQGEEELGYEVMLDKEKGKRSPEVLKASKEIKESDSSSMLGIFTKIILPIAVVFGGLTLAVTKGIDTIKDAFENIKTSISNVVNSILESIGIKPKQDELVMPVIKPIEQVQKDLEAIKFDDKGNIISGLKPSEAAALPEVPESGTSPQRVESSESATHDTSPTREAPRTSAGERNIFESVREAMAGSESGGKYDSSFNDYLAKSGVINTKNMQGVMTPEKWSEINLGSKKKLTDFTLAEVQRFQNYRDSISPGSSALGRYGFMRTTLFGLQNGNKSIPGLVQKLGLPMDAKFDKNTQDTIQDLLVRGNIAILKSGSVPITPENVYMAQMLGPSGAVWVNQALRAGQGDKLVADVLAERSGARDKEDYKGRLLKHNPQLVGVRAKDLAPKLASSLVNRGGLSQSLIGKSMEGQDVQVASAPSMDTKNNKAEAVNPSPATGAAVSQTAMTNTELKAQTGGNVNVVNVTNVSQSAKAPAPMSVKDNNEQMMTELLSRMVT